MLSRAVENPDKVAGIYPASNIASDPSIARASPSYEMTPEELQAHLTQTWAQCIAVPSHEPNKRIRPYSGLKPWITKGDQL
jgi:hypothetical protein